MRPQAVPQRRWGLLPQVWRGVGRDWPAVRHWTFAHLGALDPHRPVQVVRGNRETGATRLVDTTWGQHLSELNRTGLDTDAPVDHLKEFDLLKHFPNLADDLELTPLFPPGSVCSHQAWIGPAQARTGLHYDLLDNVALTIRGRKRFYLLPPGSVQQMRLASSKYDRWARLSLIGIDQLMATHGALGAAAVKVVDLDPGDALYVPQGWWHEVVNLEASVLLSGFFGTRWRTWGVWLQTGAWQLAHNAGIWRRGHCTCHCQAAPTA